MNQDETGTTKLQCVNHDCGKCKEMQAKIETIYAMYEVAVKQRDYLMDQQRAQVEAMRGRVQ
jgi:hypothetical protein